ncbi:MAG: protoporphyrinogen oxidase [Acidobacteria bacterium]|nr:protoporphyrinogen oxidase [Acidobacteriota bacterium]
MIEGLIIGGGISGLALAHFMGLHERPSGWQIWEASNRLGGTIGTDRTEGYSIDWGPNGFLDREPLTLRLVHEIGLDQELERASEKSVKRFILKNGRLLEAPLSAGLMLKTPLLSPLDKMRICAEPLVPGRRDDGEESVFDFAARRIGRGAAETLVDPMVSGIFGGLARELSLPSCFPIMREMEIRHGGLVKAMIARMMASRSARKKHPSESMKSGGPAGPAGWLTSFYGGLDILVQRLQQRLQPVIQLDRMVSRIRRQEDGWEAASDNGHTILAKRVVLACPTYAAADFMKDFDRELESSFAEIPYAPIVVVATGHKRSDISHPLDGFGFLIPRAQGLRTLGSIWTSSIFSGRTPEGYIQFRSMIGGAGDPSASELSDDELWSTLKRELGPLLGIKSDPAFIRIYRWRLGIPQFTLGHRERRSRLEKLASRHRGLFMIGNAYYGVGLNDCVKMAHRVAQEIAA